MHSRYIYVYYTHTHTHTHTRICISTRNIQLVQEDRDNLYSGEMNIS